MKTEVIRSPRRRKTIEARMVGDTMRVMLPASFTKEEEAHWVEEMRRRLQRKTQSTQVDLGQRARKLARKHGLPEPWSIEFSARQKARWGSCTPETRAIRISSQLLGVPVWVLDYVVVHELAHLVEPNHTKRFWELVNRYDLAERARGYLMALQDR